MKRLLLKRILPFMMAMIMLASFCLPAGAFTIGSSGTSEEDLPYYTIELEDGILRVKLNPQKVYDLLADGDLTREELEKFIPADVLEATEGGLSVDKLTALAAEYITPEELEKLLGILPKNLLTTYFLNPEFLEQLITLDEILALVDVDALLAGVEDEEKFSEELNGLLTPVLDDLLTDEVQKKLIGDQSFMESVLADAVDRLLAEHEKEVMDVLPELVTDAVVDSILANEAYKKALADLVRNDDHILSMILDDEDISHRLALYLEDEHNRNHAIEFVEDEKVIAEIKAHPEWIMTEDVIAYMFRHNKLTTAVMEEVFGADVLRDLIADNDYAIMKELMKDDHLIGSVIGSEGFAEIAATVVTDSLLDAMMSKDGFDVTDYFTSDRLSEILLGMDEITPDALLDKKLIKLDASFAEKFPAITPETMIEKGHLNPDKISIDKVKGLDAEKLYDDGVITKEEIIAAYSITEDDILAVMIDGEKQTALLNGWDTAEELFANIDGLVERLASVKGITPASLIAKNVIDMTEVLNKYPDAIDLADILATDGAVNVDAILAYEPYGITADAILNKNIVTPSEVFDAFGLSLSDLSLTDAELKKLADEMMKDAALKSALKDSFVNEVKAGTIDPIDFLDYIDLAAIANDPHNGIDLAELVHVLVDTDPKADEHLAALVSKVTLSVDEHKEIFEEIGYAQCVQLLDSHLEEILNDIGLDPFFDHFPVMDLTDALFGSEEQSGFMYLLNENIFTFDKIAIAIGGVEKPAGSDAEKKSAGLAVLASKLDSGLVVEKLGDLLMQYVTFAQIIEWAGGFNVILGWYSTEELITLVKKIGPAKLFNLAKNNGMLTSPAAKDAVKSILGEITADKAKLKDFVKGLKTPLTQILVEEISTMTLNGTTFFKNGIIDVEEAIRTAIRSIPDVEDFCKMKSDDIIVNMVLHTTFRNDGDMKLGMEVSFNGDFTKLQELAESQKDLWRIEVGEDDLDLHLSSVLPSKVMSLYEKVLTADRLPADLKGKLLMAPDLTIPELAELFGDLDDALLEKLANTVDEKLDSVLAKADPAVEKLPEGARSRVDAILEKLRTVDGWKAIIEKIQTAANKLPEAAKNLTVAEMYKGSGYFEMKSVSYDVDLGEKVSDKLGLPAGMLNADLSGELSGNVTFRGLYRLTLDNRFEKKVFFLPAGISLDVLANVEGLDLTVFEETLPETMPTMDTVVTPPLEEDEYELIFVLHRPDGSVEMMETIVYKKNDTTLPKLPDDPEAIRGYKVNWPNYMEMMGVAPSQVVDVRYDAITYQLTYQKGDKVDTVNFTVETIDDIELALDDAGHGYTYGWKVAGEFRDVEWIKAYLKNPANNLDTLKEDLGTITQEIIYTVYTISFHNIKGELFHKVEYTVNGLEDGAYMPDLSTPEQGYMHLWWNETDGEAFDPTAFDFKTAKDLKICEKADLLIYSYVFVLANGDKITWEYTIETTAKEFEAGIPANTAKDPAGDFWYEWELTGTFPALEAATYVYESKNYKIYTITFDKLEDKDTTLNYTSISDWEKDLIASVPELTDDTAAYTYGWYVDANENGKYDAGEAWNPATFDVGTKKDITVKEYRVLKEYTYTFADVNFVIHDITITAETTRDDLIAALKAEGLPTTPEKGYYHYWVMEDGTTVWTPSSYEMGSVSALKNQLFYEKAELRDYTVTLVPLKGNTSGEAGTSVEIGYTVESLTLTGVPALHTVTSTNNKLYSEYLWYIDLNGNGVYDAGEKWDPIQDFDASVCEDFTVYEYGVPVNYQMSLKPLSSATNIVITYNANNWPEVYEQLTDLLTDLKDEEIGSYTYEWYSVNNKGSWVKHTFPEKLTNSNATSHDGSYTEVRRVENNNKLYVFDKDGNKLTDYLYAYDGIYERDEYGNDVAVSLPVAPTVTHYDFANWMYAGKTLNKPEATDIVFDLDTFLTDLNLDLKTATTAQRRINIMPGYTAHLYVLTFKVEGEADQYAYYSVETNLNELVIPAPPVANAHDSYGWYLDANGNGQYDKGEEWNKNKLNLTDPTDLTLGVYAYPTEHKYTFIYDNGNHTDVNFTYETTPDSFAAKVPGNTAENNAYSYAWYVDANGNGQFDEGEQWTAARFMENGLTAYEVREYRILKTYTYTFVSFDGTVKTYTYSVLTTKQELEAEIPAQTAMNVKFMYYWAESGARWTIDSFKAGDVSALRDYTIEEKQEGRPYTITFIPLVHSTGADDTAINKTYSVDSSLQELTALIPDSNSDKVIAYRYFWYRDANGNNAYDAGEEWSVEDVNMDPPENFTVRQGREAIVYTMTFQPLVGDKVTINYSIEDKAKWSTTIKPLIPVLTKATGDDKGVYEYLWFYEDADGALVNKAATYFNTLTEVKLTELAHDFVEIKRIDDANIITFYGRDGKSQKIATFYYDREKVVYLDKLNRQVELEKDEHGKYKYPVAPEILGYVFDGWMYAGSKTNPSITDRAFSLETFREDFGVDFSKTTDKVNVMAQYKLTPYYLTFKQAGKEDVVVEYNVETARIDLEARIPALPANTMAYSYRWINEAGERWSFDNFDHQAEPGNYTIYLEETILEYVVTFVMVNGDRHLVFYDVNTTREEFERQIPELLNGPGVESWWILDGQVWTVDSLFGPDASSTAFVNAMNDYRIEEKRIADSFVLTFKDLNGVRLTQVIYNAGGPIYGSVPALPSSADGYSYYWWNTNEDVKWDGFNPLEAKNLILELRRDPITYTLTFLVPPANNANPDAPKTEVTRTYTVLDKSFQLPESTAPGGMELAWFIGEGEAKSRWYKEDLRVGNLTLVGEFVNLNYSVDFVGEDGTFIKNFIMTKDTKSQLTVPPKAYYLGNWYVQLGDQPSEADPKWSDYDIRTTVGLNIRVYVKYEAIPYTVTFQTVDGKFAGSFGYGVDSEWTPRLPVPTCETPGYEYRWVIVLKQNSDGSIKEWCHWADFEKPGKSTAIVRPMMFPVDYTVNFTHPDGTMSEGTVTVERKPVPSVEMAPGYKAVWYVQLGADPADTDPTLADYDLTSGGLNIKAYSKPAPIEYRLTFEANGKKVGKIYTVEDEWLPIAAPHRPGYTAEWGVVVNGRLVRWNDYDLKTADPKKILNARAVYTLIKYTVTFTQPDGTEKIVYLAYNMDLAAKTPALTGTAPAGYRYVWYVQMENALARTVVDIPWSEYKLEDYDNTNVTVYAKLVPLNVQVVDPDDNTHDTTTEGLPTITPPEKDGYEGEYVVDDNGTKVPLDEYKPKDENEKIEVEPVYKPIENEVVFRKPDGDETHIVSVEKKPDVEIPAKPGYNGEWYVVVDGVKVPLDEYIPKKGEEPHAEIVYTPIEYNVTFTDENGNKQSMTMNVVDGKNQPETEKAGYDWYVKVGDEWISWKEYALENTVGENIEVVFKAKRYTATFYADGQVVGTTTFTVEDEALTGVPAIPEKDGYSAKWGDYTIEAKDLEIHAVYTKDASGMLFGLYWVWWLLILILIILIVLTLIYFFVIRARKLAAAAAAAVEEEPEAEPEVEPVVVPEPEVIPEIEVVETVDVDTADAMMDDTVAMAALETVGGAKAAGMKSIINISDINNAFDADETVDLEALKAKKMVPAKTERLKVLAGGHLDKPLTVIADSFSVQAIKMITLTGGKAIQKKIDQ